MTDSQVATMLLDSYEDYQKHTETCKRGRPPQTSTPATKLPVFQPSCSESEVKVSLDEMSGVFMPSESGVSSVEEAGSSSRMRGRLRRKTKDETDKGKTSSFINPFDLSISVTENIDDDDVDSDDEDYEVSCNITLRRDQYKDLEELTVGDVEFGEGAADDKDVGDMDEEEHQGTGVTRVLYPGEWNLITDDECVLVYLLPLLKLANKKIADHCQVKGCRKTLLMNHNVTGSAIYLKWVCESGHLHYRWCSQPVMFRGLHAGDLLISAATLVSGNNFTKIALFAKFLKLKFPAVVTYNRIQSHYLIPTIDEYWIDHQHAIVEEFTGKDIVMLGDGRMDSPGYCAQYCSYTALENDTQNILNVITLDKRETDRKSGNMEKVGFHRTLKKLADDGLKVVEVVTDAHTQIGALMKKNYPDIKHSHDVWHAAKNLGEKILAENQTTACRPVKNWCQDITNHFWHVCQNANTYEEFIGMWCGVLHHVVNEHSWAIPYSDAGTATCSHGPLVEKVVDDSKWLIKGSEAHVALRKIVLKKNLLNKVSYYLNFRSTAELENYHQLILMYTFLVHTTSLLSEKSIGCPRLQ